MAVTGKGILGWRGKTGLSAYELALKNGFVGTEQDWLATLGTSSHFTEDKTLYTTKVQNEKTLDLPNAYTSNSFIDIYVEGNRLDSSMYSIDTSTRKINLTNALPVVGTKVEIVCLTMSTNTLEVSETIHEGSTNKIAAGTKAVYDFVKEEVPKIINDNTPSTNNSYSSNKVDSLLSAKLDTSNIQVITGSVPSIGAGATNITDLNYPAGFDKNNTLIIAHTCMHCQCKKYTNYISFC